MGSVLLETFLIVFLAEMGDKSQLLMVAMTAEYKMRHILIGTALSVLALTLVAVAVGAFIGDLFPKTAVSLIAGAAFLLFAVLGVGAQDEDEKIKKRRHGAILSVFGTYFLAELGDKTQLSALTLSAGAEGDFWRATVPVFFGTALALYAADILGLLVGVFLDKRLPQNAFRMISVILFFVCGVLRLLDGFTSLFAKNVHGLLYAIAATMVLSLAFVVVIFRHAFQKNDVEKKEVHL